MQKYCYIKCLKESYIIQSYINVSQLLHCENHFRRFCCILLLYLWDHFIFISLIFKSSCHMNSTTFGQWEVQSIEHIFSKRWSCIYISQVFSCYFIYYHILNVPSRCMHSECCISWCQVMLMHSLWRNDVWCCATLHNVTANNNVLHDTEFHDAALHMMLHCKIRWSNT